MKLDNDLKIRFDNVATDDVDSMDLAFTHGLFTGAFHAIIGISSVVAVTVISHIVCVKIDEFKRKKKK